MHHQQMSHPFLKQVSQIAAVSHRRNRLPVSLDSPLTLEDAYLTRVDFIREFKIPVVQTCPHQLCPVKKRHLNSKSFWKNFG